MSEHFIPVHGGYLEKAFVYGVEVVASLPCYTAANVDAQRGLRQQLHWSCRRAAKDVSSALSQGAAEEAKLSSPRWKSTWTLE